MHLVRSCKINTEHFCDIFAPNAEPGLTTRKHDKLKLRDIPQNDWTIILKNIKVLKGKEKLRKRFSLKKAAEQNWV